MARRDFHPLDRGLAGYSVRLLFRPGRVTCGLVPRARARGHPTGAAVRRLAEAGRAVRLGHGAGRGWAAERDSGGTSMDIGVAVGG